MAPIKTFYKGKIELTMSEFEKLASIDEDTDYNIMDYPDNGMTNAQLVETLNYTRLFKVGHITICLDDGAFLRGHIIQLQYIDGVRVWTDITATVFKTEQAEVIYDMNGGSSLNWGRDNGIPGGVTVNNKDFSKYKGLYVYVRFYGETQKVYVDITKPTGNNEYCAGYTNLTKNIDNYDSSLIVVNNLKTSISVILKYGVNSWSTPHENDAYVYRIEGAL